jgi:hypothetical protein
MAQAGGPDASRAETVGRRRADALVFRPHASTWPSVDTVAQNRTVNWMLFLWTWSQAYDFHP